MFSSLVVFAILNPIRPGGGGGDFDARANFE